MKIVSVVGTRPNFVKLFAVAPYLTNVEHIIIHTGQHYDYELSKAFFKEFNLPEPDYYLGVGSGTHGYQVGEMIKRIESALLEINPDLVIVYGDTNSTLAGAIAAKKAGFRVAHVEAGYRSYDFTIPEEINRRIIDHISDILFAPTKRTVMNLKRENVLGKIFLVGDVHLDVLLRYIDQVKRLNIYSKLGLNPKDYYLLTVHRAKNTDLKERLLNIINAVIDSGKLFVFPIHPRTKKALMKYGLWSKVREASNIIITEPLAYLKFINILMYSKKVLTDSGGVQREAYYLGIPCITLRDVTEMPELLEANWNVLVGADYNKILDAIKNFEPPKSRPKIFGDGNSGRTIAKIIMDELSA